MKTILLATDGSASSESALAFAIALAQETGASLHAVSVRSQGWAGRAVAPIRDVGEQDSRESVAEGAAARARSAGVTSFASVAHGDIVSCIIDTAIRLDAELLVVGSRGLGSISAAALGSVSQALVRRSPVPVTVVRHTGAASAART
jgi:nucleotide-binding universal stress UspA family protein